MDGLQNKTNAGDKDEHKFDWLKIRTAPYRWKKGQSGNPGGKPKNSLKAFTAAMLAAMSPEEKKKFLNAVSKEVAWKMAEGNPEQELMGKDGKDLIPETLSPAMQKYADKLLNEQRINP